MAFIAIPGPFLRKLRQMAFGPYLCDCCRGNCFLGRDCTDIYDFSSDWHKMADNWHYMRLDSGGESACAYEAYPYFPGGEPV